MGCYISDKGRGCFFIDWVLQSQLQLFRTKFCCFYQTLLFYDLIYNPTELVYVKLLTSFNLPSSLQYNPRTDRWFRSRGPDDAGVLQKSQTKRRNVRTGVVVLHFPETPWLWFYLFVCTLTVYLVLLYDEAFVFTLITSLICVLNRRVLLEKDVPVTDTICTILVF